MQQSPAPLISPKALDAAAPVKATHPKTIKPVPPVAKPKTIELTTIPAPIPEEIETRLLEGVPKEMLINNTFIFSMFNGENTGLYSLPIEPFFQEFDREDGVKIIRPRLHEIKPWTVNVTCFNLPPDMSSLQNFQRHLKGLCDFENELFFIDYYVKELKQVFGLHASIDPSITTSFDVYFQRCIDGHSIMLPIKNEALCSSVPKELNYWDHFLN